MTSFRVRCRWKRIAFRSDVLCCLVRKVRDCPKRHLSWRMTWSTFPNSVRCVPLTPELPPRFPCTPGSPSTPHPSPDRLLSFQILQSLEESSRWRASQRPDFSSDWRDLPAESLTRDPNPPPTGTILPLSALLESRFLHSLEESSRWRAFQRPDSSTYWRNLPAEDHPMKRKEPQRAAVSQSAVLPDCIVKNR